MTAPNLLSHLRNVRRTRAGWTARCPGHEDHKNSLKIDIGEDQRVLLKCFAGCSTEAIVMALGLQLRDLFARAVDTTAGPRGEGETPIPPGTPATLQPPGCTLAQYADAKRLPLDFLRQLGLRDFIYLGAPAVRIPYCDVSGTEVAVRFRTALTEGEVDERFKWRKGSTPCLYGLWRLELARAAGWVAIVEGESDTQTLWHHDLPALGLPGAATWREEWAAALDGIPTLYVVIEPDRGGMAVRDWLATSRLRHCARLVRLEGAKDPSVLYLSDPTQFRERWSAVLAAAIPWADEATRTARAHAEAAWRQCAALASEPRILDRFVVDLHQRGIVGEDRAAQLLFLAVVSRYLERLVSLAIKGPSSAGKSYVAEGVLAFHPARAAYCLSAMSERALAYSQEPLAHRMLVIYEAVGLKSEFASYLVRSLLSEGLVRYETVEKTKDGLKPRLIEREGPTGLIVTTTSVRLHDENETRLLSVPVSDTPDQTRAVLRELARARSGSVDVGPWHALAEWLETAEHRVVIPFATALAELIPPVAVRLRRDFGVVLTLTRAHALLHQATRSRTAEGAIVATLDDYAVVRALVLDLVADAVEATVPTTIRETVETIARLGPGGGVTVAAVARALELDKGTAWRRVRVALDRGYVENLEDKKGRQARLVLGDSLPEDQVILPPADHPGLQGCTVAPETERIYSPPSPPGHFEACNCAVCVPPEGREPATVAPDGWSEV
jgi:hypothetical protein